jgi:hypothetical protein
MFEPTLGPVVFVHRQAEISQTADHDVGSHALARRAWKRGQLGEKVDDPGPSPILCRTLR